MLRELESPDVWNATSHALELGKERAKLESIVHSITAVESSLRDASELLILAADDQDAETVGLIAGDLEELETSIAKLEFHRMFSGEMDGNNAFLDIQAGSGGTPPASPKL